MLKQIVSVCVLTFVFGTVAFGEYSTDGQLIDIHVQEGVVFLSGIPMESTSTLCPSINVPTIVLEGPQKSPAAKELYSSALAAYMTGKTVKISAFDCVNGHDQPRVVGIKLYGN